MQKSEGGARAAEPGSQLAWWVVIIAVAAGCCLLSGCSSGGPGTFLQEPTATRPPEYTGWGEEAVTVQRAALAVPRFGSVTQSNNVDSDGVTTDQAEGTYADGHVTLVVEDEDDEEIISLASETAGTVDSYDVVPFRAGYTAKRWWLSSETEDPYTYTFANVFGEWNDDGDWLTGGNWAEWTEDGLSTLGAFVDGPELDGDPTLPVSGTATYQGFAWGSAFILGEYGSDYSVMQLGPEDSEGVRTTFANYEGQMQLAVDFEAKRVSGYIFFLSTTDFYLPYHLYLEAPVEGSFDGDVTVISTNAGVIVANSSGAWGGKFSTVEDLADRPYVLAGTHGVEFTTVGNTRAALIGVHVGTTPSGVGTFGGPVEHTE